MNKKPHRYAMWILSKVVSTNILVKLIDRQMRKFNNRPRKFMINLCSYHPLSRQVFPVSYFKERFESFEGHMLPVPSEAEYMLKTIYGKITWICRQIESAKEEIMILQLIVHLLKNRQNELKTQVISEFLLLCLYTM